MSDVSVGRRAATDRRRRDLGRHPWTGRDQRAGHERRTAVAVDQLVVRPPRHERPRAVRTSPRHNPTLWEAMAVDPTLHVPADSLDLQIRNYQRGTRRWLKGVLRIVCGITIRLVLFLKRKVPFAIGSERALNWIGPRFMRRFASPETLDYVLRHFVIESNLVNFVAANCGADDVLPVDLRPTSAAGLGEHNGVNAVAEHDANIFNLVIDLGQSAGADVFTRRPIGDLDFSMLTIPAFDLDPGVRRWMQLDLESALYITVAALAIFMDHTTAERAVNSFQLDESLLASIANMTGDPVFRTWTPIKFGNWVGMTNDIGRDLHWHIIVNEYAHTRLCWMRDAFVATTA